MQTNVFDPPKAFVFYAQKRQDCHANTPHGMGLAMTRSYVPS